MNLKTETQYDESLIRITECNILGALPDLFTFDDGRSVTAAEQWGERRGEIYDKVVSMQYGTIPPAPEFLRVEPIYRSNTTASYRITTGRRDHPVVFYMRYFKPDTSEKVPVIVDGDLCWSYAFDREWLHAALDRNIGVAMFSRTELAPDLLPEKRSDGPLYAAYPDYTFGALGAWAWGYARCVDALEQIGCFDMSCVAFSGHSRGGKTALLAGALDTRAAIVNPNGAGAGGTGCYRLHLKAINEDGVEQPSETLQHLIDIFSYWFGPEMPNYTKCEEKLPFDCHMLKAMIAPRILLDTEAASDIWANPVGTWATNLAAKQVYELLGCPDNLLWHYRKGVHAHKVADMQVLCDVICHVKYGEPLEGAFGKKPFASVDLSKLGHSL